MTVLGINHIVLWVRDADRSAEFYQRALGFRVAFGTPGRAWFLQAEGSTNDHDLAVMGLGPDADDSAAGSSSVGMYHVAWEVDTLAELQARADALSELGALVGASDHGTTKALYAKDPDGLEFEVSWLVPADRLDDATLEARSRIGALDLTAEIERYGADTRGGVGISVPA
jgi:catechol-2,3-dioxygenase